MSNWRTNKEIGAYVADLRSSRGWSQQRFAEEVGLPGSQARVGLWERGKERPPYDVLVRIAGLADAPVSVFYCEEPTEATPLTTQDVARLRDEVRTLRDTAEGVLADLEAALNGRPTLSEKDAQTGATAMAGVTQATTPHTEEETPAARPKRRGSRQEPVQERDDQ